MPIHSYCSSISNTCHCISL